MKLKIFTLMCLATSLSLVAQDKPGVGIGGKNIDKAAMLDIQATNKGLLIPRVDLEATTVLNGGVNPEGVIVYNKGAVLAHGFYYWSGTKWEMVTGDSYLTEELTRIETHFKEEINKIIDGGQGTDVSYLVSYNPITQVYSYLKPNATGGYDKIEIDFESIVRVAETNTFIREVLKTINPGTPEEKEVVSAYIYFPENVIKDWKLANPAGNPIADMENALGTKIDVLGVVTSNFKEIIENTTNIEIITEIIKNVPYNVWVEDRGAAGVFLVYLDANKVKQEIDLNYQETQTSIFKHLVVGDGNTGAALPTEILDLTELHDGGIYYSYIGEFGKTFYINMTNDIINSIHNSETVKKEIFDTVNEYNSLGGNVFYGKMTSTSTDDVLFIIKNGVAEQIDISKDILKVIEDLTNNIIIEKLLERTKIVIKVDEADVTIGTSIDGNKVYKGKRTITIFNSDGYDVTFTNAITVNPSKKVYTPGTGDFVYESTNEKIESLLSAIIINKTTKQIAATNVTDVSITTDNKLRFNFGMGIMYTVLPNGEYEVIFEYTAK